jgi:lambda family phage portal protein
MGMKGRRAPRARGEAMPAIADSEPQVITASSLQPYQRQIWDGAKFPGGLNPVDSFFLTDYWTLRKRSSDLFEKNLYARGLIRRLVTNVINTGLHLESTPVEKLLGLEEESLSDWAEDVETRFELWGSDPWMCDASELRTFGAMQAAIYSQALVDGDVLVTLRQSKSTGLPRVQIISGALVQTPMNAQPVKGNKICHGVELDSQGRQVAYWVAQDDNTSKRLPAYGEKSGRKLAWLVYGTDRRHDDVRGKPLLSLVLQSLGEIDKFRDATQRKAVITSMLAMFVKKTTDKPGTRPVSNGGISRRTETTTDSTGATRRFGVTETMPGVVMEELQTGEEPVAFQQNGAVEGFGVFEEAIVQAIAWANEIPPEILRLAFSSNYSASKAANNEFDMFVGKVRTLFGDEFCRHVFIEWLVASALNKDVKATGLVESWRDNKRYNEFAAWTYCDWSGQLKASIDLSKITKAYKDLLELGLTTHDRAAREITGMKHSRVVKTLKRENIVLAEANRPIVELERPPTPPPNTKPVPKPKARRPER